jgi:hypothetical protein
MDQKDYQKEVRSLVRSPEKACANRRGAWGKACLLWGCLPVSQETCASLIWTRPPLPEELLSHRPVKYSSCQFPTRLLSIHSYQFPTGLPRIHTGQFPKDLTSIHNRTFPTSLPSIYTRHIPTSLPLFIPCSPFGPARRKLWLVGHLV